METPMILKLLGLQQLLDKLFDEHWCTLPVHDASRKPPTHLRGR